MQNAIVLPVVESSQVGEARRNAITLARQLDFHEIQEGKVGLVVTEVAQNLARHAQQGQILIQAKEEQGVVGIEILSLDKGPGIKNIHECLQDGFSTAGTLGNGMGAIERLCDRFDIYSVPDQGTAILCQIWDKTPPPNSLQLGVICLPKPGEPISGDAWAVETVENRYLFLVADGLGHGALAANASLEAVRLFLQNIHRTPSEMMEIAHSGLRSTRGAAMAIAEIDSTSQSLQYVGIGNIAGSTFCEAKSTSMVSHNGTVGHEVRKIQPFNYAWSHGGVLIMHSDGLGTQWNLQRYPGLIYKHPSLIAGVLYRDFRRERDDVTVLVAKLS